MTAEVTESETPVEDIMLISFDESCVVKRQPHKRGLSSDADSPLQSGQLLSSRRLRIQERAVSLVVRRTSTTRRALGEHQDTRSTDGLRQGREKRDLGGAVSDERFAEERGILAEIDVMAEDLLTGAPHGPEAPRSSSRHPTQVLDFERLDMLGVYIVKGSNQQLRAQVTENISCLRSPAEPEILKSLDLAGTNFFRPAKAPVAGQKRSHQRHVIYNIEDEFVRFELPDDELMNKQWYLMGPEDGELFGVDVFRGWALKAKRLQDASDPQGPKASNKIYTCVKDGDIVAQHQVNSLISPPTGYSPKHRKLGAPHLSQSQRPHAVNADLVEPKNTSGAPRPQPPVHDNHHHHNHHHHNHSREKPQTRNEGISTAATDGPRNIHVLLSSSSASLTAPSTTASIRPPRTGFDEEKSLLAGGTPPATPKCALGETTVRQLSFRDLMARISPDAEVSSSTQHPEEAGRNPFTVAVLDSGCVQHKDLDKNLWRDAAGLRGRDFTVSHNSVREEKPAGVTAGGLSSDSVNHGSSVASLIAAVASNVEGIAGICLNCKIMCLKIVEDKRGAVSLSATLRAIDFVLGQNVKLTNHSYGGFSSSRIERSAHRALSEGGVLQVIAAGNLGLDIDQGLDPADTGSSPSTREYEPACRSVLPGAITVGASSRIGWPADFSNHGGRTVSLFAPGESVIAIHKDSYDPLSGTSFSAPIVAGIAATLWDLEPNLTAEEIKQRLLDSANRVSTLRHQAATPGIACLYNALLGVHAPVLQAVQREGATALVGPCLFYVVLLFGMLHWFR